MTTINLLYDIAVKRFDRGAYEDAERLLNQIVEQTPDHVDAAHTLARVSIEQRRCGRALELMNSVTMKMPDHPEVLITLGRAYLGMNRGGDAVTCLERALLLSPGIARIHRFLSDAYLAERDFEQAIRHGVEAVRLDPTDASACASLGNAYLELRQAEQALAVYEKSIALDPDNWQVFANRGMAFLLQGRLEEAKDALTFANALSPLEPSVALTLAGVLIDLGEFQDADLILRRLSATMPGNPLVHRYAGINALKQGQLKTAVGELIKALSLDEENLDTKMHLGEALMMEGKIENAAVMFRQVLEERPEHLTAHVQKAKTALLQNRLDEGFEAIEAMQVHVSGGVDAPLWDGGDVTGKSILTYSQFGQDEFNLFVRFAGALKQRGATVVVVCGAPVQPVVSAMAAVDAVLLPGQTTEKVDFHTPLERLPALFGITEPEDLYDVPYFAADKVRTEKWREVLAGSTKRTVGIMWRKESDQRANIFRSIPLAALASLADMDGIELVSLQTTCGKEELERCGFKQRIRHLDELENVDLSERLAAVAALDLIISVDSYTAEIAAAAGIPVWMLLSTAPDWYYGLETDRAVWLPTARLFRQTTLGRWDDVIASVVEALR
jgi:Flp pilus assembly protein TadD